MRREQREHRPDVLGPRVYFRGRYAGADLRPWGGERLTLRDPAARGWPSRGDRTEDVEVAERWKWKYVDYYRDVTKRRQLGLAPKAAALGDRVDAFLVHRRRAVEDRTYVTDNTGIRAHLLPSLGASTRADSVETPALQAIVDRLLDGGYQVSTIERYVASWSAFFAWLGVRHADNPAQDIILPRPGEADIRAFTNDELAKIRRAADTIDRSPVDRQRENRMGSVRLAIELGLGTGGRQAELMALDWSQFRESERTVRFTTQVTRDRRGVKSLKGKVARTTLVLPSWWTFHKPKAKGRVLTWSRDVGRTADISTVYLQLKAVYVAAGVDQPGVGWHTLRHTYSRLFLELGGRLEELQKSLGHASIKTTEKHYAHFTPESAAALARLRIYGDLGQSGLRMAGRKGRA